MYLGVKTLYFLAYSSQTMLNRWPDPVVEKMKDRVKKIL